MVHGKTAVIRQYYCVICHQDVILIKQERVKVILIKIFFSDKILGLGNNVYLADF